MATTEQIVEWQYPHWDNDEWSWAKGVLKYQKANFYLVEIDGNPTILTGVTIRKFEGNS